MATQCFVENVPPTSGEHRSCHMQVSSVLQQFLVDDLLLVAVGTQHHDSHHKTVFAERLF